ncbi:MAG: gas vesicle protein K [Candidatus Korobacteraceae bacterium]|jgi:gas vesicle protein GvpK
MASAELARVESEHLSEFAQVLEAGPELCRNRARRCRRLDLDSTATKNGLAQLVLTLVKLLHEVLERQAIRRVESGSLSNQQIERLGLALMQQGREIERLRKEFDLEEEDLNLDLGPLGRLL